MNFDPTARPADVDQRMTRTVQLAVDLQEQFARAARARGFNLDKPSDLRAAFYALAYATVCVAKSALASPAGEAAGHIQAPGGEVFPAISFIAASFVGIPLIEGYTEAHADRPEIAEALARVAITNAAGGLIPTTTPTTSH